MRESTRFVSLKKNKPTNTNQTPHFFHHILWARASQCVAVSGPSKKPPRFVLCSAKWRGGLPSRPASARNIAPSFIYFLRAESSRCTLSVLSGTHADFTKWVYDSLPTAVSSFGSASHMRWGHRNSRSTACGHCRISRTGSQKNRKHFVWGMDPISFPFSIAQCTSTSTTDGHDLHGLYIRVGIVWANTCLIEVPSTGLWVL